MSKKITSFFIMLVMLISLMPATAAVAAPDPDVAWRQVDPADIEVGRSYLIVSEHGALVNEQATISTPGDVTGDTQVGMASRPVTIEDGLITSEVTADMIWQFGLGANTAAASGGLGEGPGYYVLNDAPGEGGGTEPLRRESSFNAQHAPINTTGAAINGNQQSVLVHTLDAEEGIVSLYIWGGNNQWNFAMTGNEDGFTAKSKSASTTSAAQLLEQMQEAPLRLYEPDVDLGVQHYVMASAGPNGSISPSSLAGHVWVDDGDDITFTFTPAFGFEVDTVTVDGEEVSVSGNTYTITNVTASGISIHVTFKPVENAVDLPFTVYNDIFSVGNVTTAVIIDLGAGNEANLADVSADMFAAAATNTRLDGSTVIFDGTRNITRAYVNTSPEPLGYISPAPGSSDLVTDTPERGRYIIVEFEFWNANGYTSGAMVSGNLQNSFSAILNYRINVNQELKLADGSTITPRLTQVDVVNHVLDKFEPDQTGGNGSMDILISIDEAWEEEGPLPLFIYNHGSGRGGSSGDPFAPVQTANGAAMLSKLQIENPGEYNAHIIATQNHANNQTNNESLIAYVEQLAAEGKVDLNRIYMSGFSMGSGYTVGFYSRNPEFLAAMVLNAGASATWPTEEQIIANPKLTETAIWASVHKDDGTTGTAWTNYFTTGAGRLLSKANVTILNTNQAFNFPYFGYDWTPHETEAQVFSNRIGQSNALHRFGPDHEEYADKIMFDWLFDQSKAEAGVVNFKLAGNSAAEVNDQAEYTLSAANMDKVATVTAWLEVDGDYFSGKSVQGLNGFEVLEDIVWESKGGSLYSGRVTLVNYSGGVTASDFTDILKLTLNSKEKLGATDVKITRIDVSGYNDNNVAVYFESKMVKDTVTTDILPWFSKYDINRDGVVDQLDLTTAQLYYGAREGEPGWDTAKIADVNDDGRVDIEDLILILNHIVW